MNTILDNKTFRSFYKMNCIKENIWIFYIKSVIANFFKIIRKPKVYIESDFGDQVYDAIHMALKQSGISSKNNKVSPYDVIEIKSVKKNTTREGNLGEMSCIGITVEFKEFELK